MLRQSLVARSVFSVLAEELRKIPALLHFHSAQSVESVGAVKDFLKGEDPHANKKEGEGTNNSEQEKGKAPSKAQAHRKAYEELMAKEEQRAREAREARYANLTWSQKLSMQLEEAKEALRQATSKQAGLIALAQHCTRAHAAEVAVEEGIDVHSVNLVQETKTSGIGSERVVVGYIDAPAATQEEVMAYAVKLQKACPVANSMGAHIEWRKVPFTPSADSPREAVYPSGAYGEKEAEFIPPRGTPGMGRYMSERNRRQGQGPHSSSLFDEGLGRDDGEDDSEFHLPGVKRRTHAPKRMEREEREKIFEKDKTPPLKEEEDEEKDKEQKQKQNNINTSNSANINNNNSSSTSGETQEEEEKKKK